MSSSVLKEFMRTRGTSVLYVLFRCCGTLKDKHKLLSACVLNCVLAIVIERVTKLKLEIMQTDGDEALNEHLNYEKLGNGAKHE